jgi:hypothetical protein
MPTVRKFNTLFIAVTVLFAFIQVGHRFCFVWLLVTYHHSTLQPQVDLFSSPSLLGTVRFCLLLFYVSFPPLSWCLQDDVPKWPAWMLFVALTLLLISATSVCLLRFQFFSPLGTEISRVL